MSDIVRIGPHTLYLGDCREILPTLGKFDLCLTDPPYGIGEAAGKNKSRGKVAIARDYGNDSWDNAPPSKDEIDLVISSAEWAALFGGNYFHVPPSSSWLVWDKLNGANDFADCELAWTNWPTAVRRIQWRWNGMIRQGNEERFHPTQKPVPVMAWCMEKAPPHKTVIDPFMGSGTTGVACAQLGRIFTGIERERKYFDIACERIAKAHAQGRIFEEVEQQPEQEQLWQ